MNVTLHHHLSLTSDTWHTGRGEKRRGRGRRQARRRPPPGTKSSPTRRPYLLEPSSWCSVKNGKTLWLSNHYSWETNVGCSVGCVNSLRDFSWRIEQSHEQVILQRNVTIHSLEKLNELSSKLTLDTAWLCCSSATNCCREFKCLLVYVALRRQVT